MSLADGDLGAALRSLASTVSSQFGVSCRFVWNERTRSQIPNDEAIEHLYHIAQEAVNNAVKHGCARQIVIGLHIVDGEVKLTVADNGIGFSETPAEYNGLGLRIMKYRAESIGGSLEIQRGESGGTVISFSSKTTREVLRTVPAIDGIRILIVEAELDVAKIARETVDDLEYNIVAVISSGEEAIEKVSEAPPSLVLMDIELSGQMSGIEAASQIHHRFNVPIIYLMGDADDQTLQRAALTEPSGYLLKPFKQQHLEMAIKLAFFTSGAKRSEIG